MGKGHVLESFDPKIFNIMQHSFQLALVWLRFIGIMVTHRTIGPLIRMLNFMI